MGVLLKGNANYPAEVITAHEQFRKTGGVVGGITLVWGRPFCIQRELDFAALLQPQPNWSDLEPLLSEDRSTCDGYYPWLPGFTPQDHMQMKVAERREKFENEIRESRDKLDMALQEQQLKFQAAQEARQTAREDARDNAMRAREDKRDADAKTRHDEQMGTLRGNHRRELIAFGGAIALAPVVAGMMQAGWMPEPGWLEHWRWWPF